MQANIPTSKETKKQPTFIVHKVVELALDSNLLSGYWRGMNG